MLKSCYDSGSFTFGSRFNELKWIQNVEFQAVANISAVPMLFKPDIIRLAFLILILCIFSSHYVKLEDHPGEATTVTFPIDDSQHDFIFVVSVILTVSYVNLNLTHVFIPDCCSRLTFCCNKSQYSSRRCISSANVKFKIVSLHYNIPYPLFWMRFIIHCRYVTKVFDDIGLFWSVPSVFANHSVTSWPNCDAGYELACVSCRFRVIVFISWILYDFFIAVAMILVNVMKNIKRLF